MQEVWTSTVSDLIVGIMEGMQHEFRGPGSEKSDTPIHTRTFCRRLQSWNCATLSNQAIAQLQQQSRQCDLKKAETISEPILSCTAPAYLVHYYSFLPVRPQQEIRQAIARVSCAPRRALSLPSADCVLRKPSFTICPLAKHDIRSATKSRMMTYRRSRTCRRLLVCTF